MFLRLCTLFPVFFLFLFFSCKSPTETPTEEPSDLYVLESDVIFGGYRDVDVYHNTIIINTSPDSMLLDVESPTPIGLKRESIRSPSFGDYAYISLDYSDYYDIPNMSKTYLTTEPDTSTSESHFWNNLRLGTSEGIHVPYSNYYGEGEELFIKSLGVNNFSGLEVTSEYKIERDEENSSYLNLEIKQTMENTTEENMYVVGIALYVPRRLMTRQIDTTRTIDTTYYKIISDTMLTDVVKSAYYRDWGKVDGFGLGSIGQDVNMQSDVLRPDESFDFTIKMTIEPLLDKFEIYPSSIITFDTKSERIWPKSIITYNGEEYNGNVDYLKVCNLGIPTYILFSINNGELKVVSPDMVEPTFSPSQQKI
jgi:hypothetical protein